MSPTDGSLLAAAVKKGPANDTYSSSSKRKQPNEAPVIDLTEDDDEAATTPCDGQITKRARTTETVPAAIVIPTTPLRQMSPGAPATPTAPARPARTLPISDNTPQDERTLYELPELAERYVLKTSIAEAVEYSNPHKFCLRPAYWRKWESRHYSKFAEHLRAQFDPIPFAQETGLPVEEVQHMFTALVCNPLNFPKEAKKRGEEGMQEILELYQKYGTLVRSWGKHEKGEKKVTGELYSVELGVVNIILDSGSMGEVKICELSAADVEYLKETLTKEENRKLKEQQGV